MRTCMSCNCYYCQTQIEKHNLSDTSYQLSLQKKTSPHCRLPSVDTQSNLEGTGAVEGSQRGGRTLDQRIFMSSEMIRFHIMSILQPDTSLICMIASQNVTFLFRHPHNIWRRIVLWFFFCQSFRVLRLIISYLTARWIAASPHIAVSGQCAMFKWWREEGVGVYGWQWADDLLSNYALLFSNRRNLMYKTDAEILYFAWCCKVNITWV